MSTQEIQAIMKRLEEQDRVAHDRSEKQKQEIRELKVYAENINKNLSDLQRQFAPVNKVFNNASGFVNTLILILKFLGLLSVGVGVVATFIYWLKER